MSKAKMWRTVGILCCVFGVGLALFANLTAAVPLDSPHTVAAARQTFSEHTAVVDAILDAHHLPEAEWEEEIYEDNLDLRKVVLLEDGEELNLVFCSDSIYAPWFRIYFTGKRVTAPEDCQDVYAEYPWMRELVETMGQGRITQKRFASLCAKERKEVLKELAEEEFSLVVSTSHELRLGLFSIGSVKYSINEEFTENEFTGEWEEKTGYLRTEMSVHMYLY
ncbi:MAG: hypothetical protein IJZ13_02705 [Clostridia bacterium]|nr:hypothetical protein [Clostridia bacterium]